MKQIFTLILLLSSLACIGQDSKKTTNEKDGIWIEYHPRTKRVKSEGTYQNGKRVGVWSFYNRQKKLTQKYNFSTNELLYTAIDIDTEKVYKVQTDTGTQKLKLTQPPLLIGGENPLLIASGYFRYPTDAKRAGLSGQVVVSFWIDENGIAKDYRVVKKFGYGCDEEALRVVTKMLPNWTPAMIDGKPVTVQYEIPISFTIK